MQKFLASQTSRKWWVFREVRINPLTSFYVRECSEELLCAHVPANLRSVRSTRSGGLLRVLGRYRRGNTH